jgi:hypothetical protein
VKARSIKLVVDHDGIANRIGGRLKKGDSINSLALSSWNRTTILDLKETL